LNLHEGQIEDKKKAKKAEEGYLEDGKITKPTKSLKSGKTNERARKA
jgi:hypothetical protein